MAMEVLTAEKMNSTQAQELYVEGLPGGIAHELSLMKLKAKELKARVAQKKKDGDDVVNKFPTAVREEDEMEPTHPTQAEEELKKLLPARTVKALVDSSNANDGYEKAPDPNRFVKKATLSAEFEDVRTGIEARLDKSLSTLSAEFEDVRRKRLAAEKKKVKTRAKKRNAAKRPRKGGASKRDEGGEEAAIADEEGEKEKKPFIMVASGNFMRKVPPSREKLGIAATPTNKGAAARRETRKGNAKVSKNVAEVLDLAKF